MGRPADGNGSRELGRSGLGNGLKKIEKDMNQTAEPVKHSVSAQEEVGCFDLGLEITEAKQVFLKTSY